MAIENRNLPAGTRLVANYKKQAFACTVEAEADGKLAYVVDGKRYKSPSSAGSAVMGGSACNGWRFWSVEGATDGADVPVAAPKERKPRTPASPREKPAPEATQPQAGDYLIDSDGRPIEGATTEEAATE